MELSQVERLLLLNQFKILSLLTQDEVDRKDYRECAEIITRGLESHYDALTQFVETRHPATFTDELASILAMYEALGRSNAQLADAEQVPPADLAFPEFFPDGADFTASEYLNWYVKTYETSSGCPLRHFSTNGQSPALPRLRAMLGRWRGLNKARVLTRDQITYVLEGDSAPEVQHG